MAIVKVLTAPDPILKKRCIEVEVVDDEIRAVMDDMLETMYHENGVGLAANQIGILKRILVLDLQEDDNIKRPKGFYPLFIVNPEIIEVSEERVEAIEACLSVPEQKINVSRHSAIKIRFLDYNNAIRELNANNWLARALQHEIDHLNGKTLIDYLTNLKKDVLLRKLTKLKKISAEQ